MTTISSSTGSFFNNTQGMSGTRPPRHDPSKMVDEIFSKLDTKGQGYLEKSDLQSAFESSASSNSASVDEVFSSLDSDGDGKITKEEMSSSLKKLSEQLDSQFNADRMAQAMGNMPPPPPPESDTGFSKDELTQQLDEATASGDTKRADLLNSIVANFDKADTDGDGKVTFKEARAYDESQKSSSTSTTSDTTTGTASSNDSDSLSSRVLRQMMRLMASYGAPEATAATSSLSVSA